MTFIPDSALKMSACAAERQVDTAPSLTLAEQETPQLFSCRSAAAVGEQIRKFESASLDSTRFSVWRAFNQANPSRLAYMA